MFNIHADEAVRALVEAVFPLPAGSGLLVTLDLRLRHPNNERNRASGSVHFVFERPQNYCKVWTSAVPESWSLPQQLAEWEMVSDHDSCWRDAVRSAINKEYFRQAKEIAERPRGGKKVVPRDLEESGYVYRIERVRLAYEVIDHYNPHRKRLTALERAR